jgi:hypothetical protein
MSCWLPWTSNEALSKLFHCSVRNTWATGWLGMVNRTSGLNKILVPRVNCRPTVRLLAILGGKFLFNLSSRLSFLEPKHTTSTLCTCESSLLDFTCRRARGGGIGYYSIKCIKLARFWYIMTSNVEYVLCINLYTLSKFKSTFCNTLYVSIHVLEHLQADSYICHLLLHCLTQRVIRNLGDWDGKGQYGLDWSGSGYGVMVGSCEHITEPSASVQCWELLE